MESKAENIQNGIKIKTRIYHDTKGKYQKYNRNEKRFIFRIEAKINIEASTIHNNN